MTYTIVVTNNGPEAATLSSLTDDKFGDLTNLTSNPGSTCSTAGAIAATGGTYTCTFTKTLSGAAGTSHTNVVTATANYDATLSKSATAQATVSFVSPP